MDAAHSVLIQQQSHRQTSVQLKSGGGVPLIKVILFFVSILTTIDLAFT